MPSSASTIAPLRVSSVVGGSQVTSEIEARCECSIDDAATGVTLGISRPELLPPFATFERSSTDSCALRSHMMTWPLTQPPQSSIVSVGLNASDTMSSGASSTTCGSIGFLRFQIVTSDLTAHMDMWVRPS